MSSAKKYGLLVMHYGTPATIDDVLPYYTHIRRGRPPEPAALQNLIDRYQAIGGPSPLARISEQQGKAIQAALASRDIEAELYIGMKHAPPFVGDAIETMARQGVTDAVGLVLAPHYSTFSIAAYKKYATDALERAGHSLRLSVIDRWGTLPALIQALAERVAAQLDGWHASDTLVIFSAHSLPEKIVAAGDPYPDELLATSKLVAKRLGLPHWMFAYQSASSTGEPWLGPDVLDAIEANASKYKNVICCTVGFVSDHLEVLYDLGVEARDKCAELGLGFRRADTINADWAVMDALGGLVAAEFHGA